MGISEIVAVSGLDCESKIILLEEYYTGNGILSETNSESDIAQFENLLETFSVTPIRGKKYIVFCLMLVNDKILPFEKQIIGEFVEFKNNEFTFIDVSDGNEQVFPPPLTKRIKSTTGTFIFDSAVAYEKVTMIIALKWGIRIHSAKYSKGIIYENQ